MQRCGEKQTCTRILQYANITVIYIFNETYYYNGGTTWATNIHLKTDTGGEAAYSNLQPASGPNRTVEFQVDLTWDNYWIYSELKSWN